MTNRFSDSEIFFLTYEVVCLVIKFKRMVKFTCSNRRTIFFLKKYKYIINIFLK